MKQTLLVGFDGSEGAQRALQYAIEQAKISQADLIIAHVIEWSPYSFLTKEELEERHQRRKEELARAEQHIITPLIEKISQQALQARGVIRYGNIANSLCEIAEEESATQIYIGRNGENSISGRLFGTVPSVLVQVSAVPVTVVP